MNLQANINGFVPGDQVKPIVGAFFASVWRFSHDEGFEGAPLAKITQGETALVIASSDRMVIVLFQGVLGYVYLYRVTKAF